MKTRKTLRTVASERGQTATEYMLMVSVLVVAVVAGAYAFVPSFTTGVGELSMDVSQILDEHGSVKGGFGVAAANAAGGGAGTTRGGFGSSEGSAGLGEIPMGAGENAASYGSGE